MIVLISESHDLQSKAHFPDVVVKAQRNDVVIYTISYSALTSAFTQKASISVPTTVSCVSRPRRPILS
jgi:hypothetical protein